MEAIKPLPVAEQIACFEYVRKKLVERNVVTTWGIYDLVDLWLDDHGYEEVADCFQQQKYLPLYHFDNAAKFKARHFSGTVYWWCRKPYDYENRIAFLEWMINELKTQK